MFRRRRQISAEETAANAARKAAKAALSMTCQCCWRQIFAETGLIAHHGYQRPGDGWQTASCMGARYLPLEADRARLGDLIEVLVNRLNRATLWRDETKAERHPITRTYANRNIRRSDWVYSPITKRNEPPEVTLAFTRENFNQLIDENTGSFHSGKQFDDYAALTMKQRGFDGLKEQELAIQLRKIEVIQDNLAECRSRYDAWEQTHKRVDNTWVKL